MEALSNTNGQKLLATIIQVEGSAYLKEGTMMFIAEDSKRVGFLNRRIMNPCFAKKEAD
ncbi:XdhC family protein [Cohnella sp.]|uniref:XdhC family protein n=1 Tax=Cohnella sp. TaxID=1883426 RepID=UPI0035692533